jgi:hypothetical protein
VTLAFYECSGFDGSLTIGSSVTTIGMGAFAECDGFTGSLTIPSSVTTIGQAAFGMCTSFDGSLTIPASVTTIGDQAFAYCTGFASIHSAMRDLSGVHSGAFSDITDTPLIGKPLTCAPELAYIHTNYGFTKVTAAAFAPSISVNDGVTHVEVGGTFTVSIDLGCAPEATLAKEDILTITNGTPGAWTYAPYSNSDGNLSTPAKTIATCVITPTAAGPVAVQVLADAFTFFDTGNSASNIVRVNLPTVVASDLAYTIPTNHIYTGSAQGIGAVAANNGVTGLGDITVKYDGEDDVPVDAGTYAVTVDIEGSEQYSVTTGLALGNYTIATKAVTITGLIAQDKAYDGTTDATATGGTLSDVVPGDQVSITVGTATFASAEVGTDIIVTFSGYGITGADAANYHLAGQPAAGRANILPPVYGVSTGSFSGGSVYADKTSALEGETVTLIIDTDPDYVPVEVSVYETDSPSTPVETSQVTPLHYTFTMPACDVTVVATFKTQEQVDQEAVEAVVAAIEGGTYHVAQETANDEVAVKAWLVNTLDALFGQSHGVQFRSATSIVGDVTITALTPAVAGTANNPPGVNGSFSFTVALTGGAGAITATVTDGVIVATAFTVVKRVDLSFIDDLTIRILNTGNVTTGELTLALSGANANAFTLPSTRVTGMPVGAYAFVPLTPRAGLTDGIYTATLTVSDDGTTLATIDIIYTVATTGMAGIPAAPSLKAWMQDGLLHVSGLTAGQPWSLYTISGALVHRSIADSHEATVRLTARGVYIVKSGAAVIKTVY